MFEYLEDKQVESFWRMLSDHQQKEYVIMLHVELEMIRQAIINMPSDLDPIAYHAKMTAMQSRHAKLKDYLQKLSEITSEQPEALAIS